MTAPTAGSAPSRGHAPTARPRRRAGQAAVDPHPRRTDGQHRSRGRARAAAARQRLRTDEGLTVLLSSHLLHQVEQVCDRIGIFVGGQLVASAPSTDLAGTLPDRWVFELGVDPGPSTRTCPTSSRRPRRAGGRQRWAAGVDRDRRAAMCTPTCWRPSPAGRLAIDPPRTPWCRSRRDLPPLLHGEGR